MYKKIGIFVIITFALALFSVRGVSAEDCVISSECSNWSNGAVCSGGVCVNSGQAGSGEVVGGSYNGGGIPATGSASVVGSQCTGTGGTGCDVTRNANEILAQCNKTYAAASCKSVKDYVETLSAVCENDTNKGDINCAKIKAGGIYGPEAAKYAAASTGNGIPGDGTVKDGGIPGNGTAKGMNGVEIPTNTGLAGGTIKDILTNLLRWLLGIVGIIALIGFAISGLQYIISSGNEEIMESAKRDMLYSIIGVIVVLASFIIIQAIDFALRAKSF